MKIKFQKLITLLTTFSLLVPWVAFAANTHSATFVLASAQDLSITDAAQVGLDLTGNYTIEMQVKITSAPGNGVVYPLIDKHQGAGDNRSYYVSYAGTAATPEFQVGINTNGTTQSTGSLTYDLGTATWKHVAFVYTAAAGTIDVYIDGVSQGQMAGLGTSIYNSAAPFTIGGTAPAAGGLNGQLDEIRIWSATRTAAQILANKCVAIDAAASLQASWHLDNALTDASGNGNTLTNNNVVTFTTDISACFASVSDPKERHALDQFFLLLFDNSQFPNIV